MTSSWIEPFRLAGDVFHRTLRRLYETRGALARWVIPVVLLLVGFQWLLSHYGMRPFDRSKEPSLAAMLFAMVLFVYITSVIACRTHRILLLGPTVEPSTASELRFAYRFLIVAIATTLSSWVVVYAVQFGLRSVGFEELLDRPGLRSGCFAVVYSYFGARWALALPASAIGVHWQLLDAWRASSSRQLLLVIVAGAPALLGVPLEAYEGLPAAWLFDALVVALLTIFLAGLVSMAFTLVEREEHAEPEELAAPAVAASS